MGDHKELETGEATVEAIYEVEVASGAEAEEAACEANEASLEVEEDKAASAKAEEEPAEAANAAAGPVVMKSMEMRILGFVITPIESRIPTRKMRYTRVCDYEMTVNPETTIRMIKDFALARLRSLHYYQLKVEFFNHMQRDRRTIKSLMRQYPDLEKIKCLHLLITVPDEMFKAMYKTFIDMGMNDEKALDATNNFMDTVQNKETDYEYDIAMRLERCRIRLEKHGLHIRNPKHPVITLCE